MLFIDYLCIDISKRSNVIAHYENRKFQKEFVIQNNKNGYNYLLKHLNDLDHPQLIFEYTGIYPRGMERFCRVNQINYIEMNSLEAKFKTSSLRSGKTDQADAHKLACLGPMLKQLDDAMIQLAQQLDYFKNIHSIPGIGKISASMIIEEIDDIKRFKSNKQLNAFVGIDIKRYQSVNTHCRDTINKPGNKKARKLLF